MLKTIINILILETITDRHDMVTAGEYCKDS